MRWSAVFAGVAVAVGLWMLLQVLGIGIGLTAIETDDAGSLKGVGIGTGIWSLISPIIAIFVGGLVAGRLSGTFDRKNAGLHGAVVWALGTLLGVFLTYSMVSNVVRGAASAGGAVVSTAATAAGQIGGAIDPGAAMSALGIQTNDLLGPINQRLQAQGKPTVTAAELADAAQASLEGALHEQRLNRELFVDNLAQQTKLSRAEVLDIYQQLEGRVGQLGTQVSQVGTQAGEMALHAAENVGKAMLILGLSMLLSLVAGVAGAAIALRRHRDDDDDRRRSGHTVVTTAPYPTTPTTPTTPVV